MIRWLRKHKDRIIGQMILTAFWMVFAAIGAAISAWDQDVPFEVTWPTCLAYVALVVACGNTLPDSAREKLEQEGDR